MAAKQREISDEAVIAATGKSWKEWLAALDAADAAKNPHAEIARLLREAYNCTPWWSQTIAVRYEQERGLRQMHQKPGGFEVNVSRTLSLPLATAFAAWSDVNKRRRWAGEVRLRASRLRANHSIRAEGPRNTAVVVRFARKGPARTQIVIEHSKLADLAHVERSRRGWRRVFDAMEALATTSFSKGGPK